MMKYQVKVLETGHAFPCGEDGFVLPAMLHSGAGPVTYGCCGGGCGACRMRVAQGEYVVAKRMSRAHVSEQEEREGIVLLCCIQPRTDLVLQKA